LQENLRAAKGSKSRVGFIYLLRFFFWKAFKKITEIWPNSELAELDVKLSEIYQK